MRKLMLSLLAALAVLAFGVACGDDDDGESSPTDSSTASGRPSRTADADVTPTDADGKTPSNETPGEDETPEPTGTGPRPSPASEGTPARLVEDPNTFFSTNYPGKSPIESECGFSPVSFIVTCGSDKYAVDPPLQGEDVACALLSIDDEPVAIRCNSQAPLQAIYYEIQE